MIEFKANRTEVRVQEGHDLSEYWLMTETLCVAKATIQFIKTRLGDSYYELFLHLLRDVIDEEEEGIINRFSDNVSMIPEALNDQIAELIRLKKPRGEQGTEGANEDDGFPEES